ncbi:MAG: hypothetical protein ACFB22_07815 [Rhodothalassiaceae bacterium]
MTRLSERRLALCLLLLRISLTVFMAIWVADKFLNPGHTAAVFAGFYGVERDLAARFSWLLGLIQGFFVLAFALGYRRTISYGVLLAMHLVSTLSSYKQLLNPFNPERVYWILFYAAIPTLAAFLILFLLRQHDRYSVDAMG